ncbi:DUF882 domain-containing protein [Spirosoma taeanense]|uniref:DUF882 domain-containing protein n=1 Tax=Spirosoma taeanense TaxID=2735870 RepID=A0A6M5YA07_9BACT|nr:DUF882 domain-containing protein [Spirosoma taeanense]QJW90206.1 DUF882 domain-containing protein [Spirosoma taeanense]
MKIVLITLLIIFTLLVVYRQISYSQLSPAVREKERQVATALTQRGLSPSYILISGYRPPWLNRLMPLSARKSVHQQGQAIDLFIFDINRDDRWNRADTDLMARLLDSLDRKHPDTRGGVGLYYGHLFSKRMVHFDVSGRHRHWNY